jgi:prepilin-type N-terminal cleavage/methylation domain-containing protein
VFITDLRVVGLRKGITVMNKRKGFTLVELLVVIAIIALLMSILMPALQKVKNQARAVVCLSNMKQWALAWSHYTSDHNGSFPLGYGSIYTYSDQWEWLMQPYAGKNYAKFWCCPAATRTPFEGGVYPRNAWFFIRIGKAYQPGETFSQKAEDRNLPNAEWLKLSYGLNEWVGNPKEGVVINGVYDSRRCWRKMTAVTNPYKVPIMLDCIIHAGYPEDTDKPPGFEGDLSRADVPNKAYNMAVFTLNRHGNGTTSAAFMDCSARTVRLKELWTLKWHKQYNTSGIYTRPDAVWPKWMSNFK